MWLNYTNEQIYWLFECMSNDQICQSWQSAKWVKGNIRQYYIPKWMPQEFLFKDKESSIQEILALLNTKNQNDCSNPKVGYKYLS